MGKSIPNCVCNLVCFIVLLIVTTKLAEAHYLHNLKFYKDANFTGPSIKMRNDSTMTPYFCGHVPEELDDEISSLKMHPGDTNDTLLLFPFPRCIGKPLIISEYNVPDLAKYEGWNDAISSYTFNRTVPDWLTRLQNWIEG